MTGKLKVLSLSKEIEGLKEKKSYDLYPITMEKDIVVPDDGKAKLMLIKP